MGAFPMLQPQGKGEEDKEVGLGPIPGSRVSRGESSGALGPSDWPSPDEALGCVSFVSMAVGPVSQGVLAFVGRVDPSRLTLLEVVQVLRGGWAGAPREGIHWLDQSLGYLDRARESVLEAERLSPLTSPVLQSTDQCVQHVNDGYLRLMCITYTLMASHVYYMPLTSVVQCSSC